MMPEKSKERTEKKKVKKRSGLDPSDLDRYPAEVLQAALDVLNARGP